MSTAAVSNALALVVRINSTTTRSVSRSPTVADACRRRIARRAGYALDIELTTRLATFLSPGWGPLLGRFRVVLGRGYVGGLRVSAVRSL